MYNKVELCGENTAELPILSEQEKRDLLTRARAGDKAARQSMIEGNLRLVLSGLMGALLVVSKQAMSGLPNIEPVTLLVILFALELPRETPGAVTVFILLQGVLYGFGLWWAMYLYVWYLLALLAWLLRRMDNALGWAVFSGIYGLCFGGLCAAVYLVAKSPALALSGWRSGLSYDAMHGVGNFVIMLLLYRPLRRALQTAKRQIHLD